MNPPPLSLRNSEAFHDAAGGALDGDKENYATQQQQQQQLQPQPKSVRSRGFIVFPGLWLVGLTPDAYRVAKAPAKR
ncbi:hypothetical protein ACJRO7_026497 [Eucalyptus globulus]|uniref:Uncharacterized protein n=1 Tax=Eucalyptus globulus TaxID=34317 RepID=A0ABD3JT28_EUCGL